MRVSGVSLYSTYGKLVSDKIIFLTIESLRENDKLWFIPSFLYYVKNYVPVKYSQTTCLLPSNFIEFRLHVENTNSNRERKVRTCAHRTHVRTGWRPVERRLCRLSDDRPFRIPNIWRSHIINFASSRVLDYACSFIGPRTLICLPYSVCKLGDCCKDFVYGWLEGGDSYLSSDLSNNRPNCPGRSGVSNPPPLRRIPKSYDRPSTFLLRNKEIDFLLLLKCSSLSATLWSS